MKRPKLRKDDMVQVVSGAAKGARGKIISVNPKEQRVIIEGVNYKKKHEKVRQTKGGQAGGITEVEQPIHISNVMIVDPKTDAPVRIGIRFDDKGNKVRFSRGKKASGESLD